jgi:hypothetical protein
MGFLQLWWRGRVMKSKTPAPARGKARTQSLGLYLAGRVLKRRQAAGWPINPRDPLSAAAANEAG